MCSCLSLGLVEYTDSYIVLAICLHCDVTAWLGVNTYACVPMHSHPIAATALQLCRLQAQTLMPDST